MIVPMGWFGWVRIGALQTDAIILGETQPSVGGKIWQIPPSVPNTVTGFMAYLDTKLLVLVIGLVGMVLLLNSFASAVSCTTKRLMPVIGPRMLVDVRNIHYAKMILMVMYHSANPAIATGPAKEVTLDFKGAPQCWFLTKIANVVWLLQLPNVIYPSLPHNPMKNKTIAEAGGLIIMKTVVEIPKIEDASNPKQQQVPAAPDPTKLHKGYRLTCPKVPRFWPDPLNNNLFQCSKYFHVSSNAAGAPVAKLMIFVPK